MPSIPRAILERCQLLKEGSVLGPKEFLHLGSRAAVDQAFSRLAKDGRLLRVARGTYVSPAQKKGTSKAPSVESVTQSIAAQGKQAIALSGSVTANKFGLSQSAPTQRTYLTTGPSRQIVIGEHQVALEHAPYWQLALGSSPAGDALRALAWLGKEQSDSAATELRDQLPRGEWEALMSARASLPCWMATALGKASIREAMR